MTGERIIKMGNGDYRETTVKNNATYVEGNYYNTSEQKQTLTEIAQEITDLLTYFEQNPTIIEAQQMVKTVTERQPKLNDAKTIEAAIEATPTLKQRLHAVGKAAYIETVKALLPPVGVAIEAVKAWNNPE